eukprot:jgi/Tetstr1/424791/TSEL_015294.t1
MVTLFPEIPIEAVDSETVRYSGAVGENGSLLSTVEVCEDGGGGGWKSLLESEAWLRNVSEFNPQDGGYYADHVLPRVLPWAAALLAVGLLFFLLFAVWRVVLWALRYGCWKRAGSRYQPTGSPSKVLSGSDILPLRVIITLGLVAVIAASIWGCVVAGPKFVHQFWDYVGQWAGYAGGVLGLWESVVRQSATLFDASEELERYLQTNADALSVDGLLECVDRVTDRVPAASAYLAAHLERVAVLVPQVSIASSAALSSLAYFQETSMPFLSDMTDTVTEMLVQQNEVRRLARVSQESYRELPSLAGDAFDAVAQIITTNVQLDPVGRLGVIAGVSDQLVELNDTISRVPELVAGVRALGTFVRNLEELRAGLPEFSGRSRPLAELLDQASECAVDSVGFATHVNATIAQLPANASFAINNLNNNTQSGFSMLRDAPQTKALLEALLEGVVVPEYFRELLGQLEQLELQVRGFSGQDINGVYRYLNGGSLSGGLREALEATAAPLRRSTNAAVLFAQAGGELAYTRFFSTTLESSAVLTRLRVAAEDPAGLEAASRANFRISAINDTLMGVDIDKLEQLVALMEYWDANELTAVGSLNATVANTLRNARQLAVDGLKGGVEEAVAYIQDVNATINSIQAATEEMRNAYMPGEVLARLDEFNNNTAGFLADLEDDTSGAQRISLAVDDARLWVTYVLFGIACLMSLMLAVGVWLAVPLLYKLGTWTLLLLLVAFFALMVPYGTTVTVASDACPLMEERLLLLASEGGGLEDTQRAGLRRLLTYWMFNQGATAATGGVSQLMGYNLVQATISLTQLQRSLANNMAAITFQPAARQYLTAVSDTAGGIRDSINLALQQLNQAAVRPAFVESKRLLCCTAVGTAGSQWMAMLVTGAAIIVTAFCLCLFIYRLDQLPPKTGRYAGWGLYCYRATDRNLGEGDDMAVNSKAGGVDLEGAHAGVRSHHVEMTPRVEVMPKAAMGPVESWLESWMPEEHIRSDQVLEEDEMESAGEDWEMEDAVEAGSVDGCEAPVGAEHPETTAQVRSPDGSQAAVAADTASSSRMASSSASVRTDTSEGQGPSADAEESPGSEVLKGAAVCGSPGAPLRTRFTEQGRAGGVGGAGGRRRRCRGARRRGARPAARSGKRLPAPTPPARPYSTEGKGEGAPTGDNRSSSEQEQGAAAEEPRRAEKAKEEAAAEGCVSRLRGKEVAAVWRPGNCGHRRGAGS